ncbi:GIY-YIG nuclease family protein [Caldalkalibacillus salinus]|uniref:GIY-YIG nuclease family protein n=1 Tax=Caldalkalibacillus salinus TaxID=2803787 RepID=UPI00192115EB|nr:GIY-YIG nuclease family protein [Caldalkalibacillus salinus]
MAERKDSQHYVYILRCKDNTLYTGYATDVSRRLAEHHAGKGAKYTRGRGPLKLVYVERCEDRSAALKREAQIKKLGRTQKIKLIHHFERKGGVVT